MRWRTFSVGIAIVVASFLGLFVGIHASASGTHRPEGTAERWLAAISDTTRKGVSADAVKRADRDGPAALGATLTVPAARRDGKRSFRDLEVGKAGVAGLTARVPYLLHQYVFSGPNPQKSGVVILARMAERWQVAQLVDRRTDERVPSEGGAPPSSAPKSYWVIALLLGCVVAVVCSGLINLAGRAARDAPTTSVS